MGVWLREVGGWGQDWGFGDVDPGQGRGEMSLGSWVWPLELGQGYEEMGLGSCFGLLDLGQGHGEMDLGSGP